MLNEQKSYLNVMNAVNDFLKKIKVSFIVQFFLGKYCFSLDTFQTLLVF